MKRNKIFSLIVCLLVVISGCFIVGCKKDESSNENKPLAVIDGFSIESIEVFNVKDNYYSIAIGTKNTNEESATFDYTQIHIMFNERELTHDGDDVLFEAGDYWKMSFSINIGDSNLSIGDSVDVYYQDELLKTVVVE